MVWIEHTIGGYRHEIEHLEMAKYPNFSSAGFIRFILLTDIQIVKSVIGRPIFAHFRIRSAQNRIPL